MRTLSEDRTYWRRPNGRNPTELGLGPNKLYAVQRSSLVSGAYTNVAEHILSTPPENVFLDVTATNSLIWFYRLKVE